MFYRVMSARFQYIIEAYHVALDVGIRIGDAITHASLGSEVHYYIKVVLLEQSVNQRLISQITLDEPYSIPAGLAFSISLRR